MISLSFFPGGSLSLKVGETCIPSVSKGTPVVPAALARELLLEERSLPALESRAPPLAVPPSVLEIEGDEGTPPPFPCVAAMAKEPFADCFCGFSTPEEKFNLVWGIAFEEEEEEEDAELELGAAEFGGEIDAS